MKGSFMEQNLFHLQGHLTPIWDTFIWKNLLTKFLLLIFCSIYGATSLNFLIYCYAINLFKAYPSPSSWSIFSFSGH